MVIKRDWWGIVKIKIKPKKPMTVFDVKKRMNNEGEFEYIIDGIDTIFIIDSKYKE